MVYPDGWACSINGVHESKQKEVRIIDTLEPVMNQHRLVVDDGVARDVVLMYQLTHICRERGCLEHDDRVDALAMVVKQFTDVLDQDAGKQAARRGEEDYVNQMRRWRGQTEPQVVNWLDHA